MSNDQGYDGNYKNSIIELTNTKQMLDSRSLTESQYLLDRLQQLYQKTCPRQGLNSDLWILSPCATNTANQACSLCKIFLSHRLEICFCPFFFYNEYDTQKQKQVLKMKHISFKQASRRHNVTNAMAQDGSKNYNFQNLDDI